MVIAIAGLAGCSDGDADGVCVPSEAPRFGISPESPAGFPSTGPFALALGGTRRLTVEELWPGPGGRTLRKPLDHRLHPRALDDGIAIADVEPDAITVAGRAAGTSKLELSDCDGTLLVPSFDLAVAAVDRIALWPYEIFDQPPVGADVALAAGAEDIAVALFSAGPQPTRLVDSSMRIAVTGGALPTSEQRSWEQLHVPPAGPGVYDVTVTAVGRHVTLPLVITDHADALEAIEPPATIAPATSVTLCFSPKLGGRHVTGFPYTFVIDGVEEPGHGPINCRAVYTLKTSGTLVVTARAGGQSTTVTLAVQP